jgi:hypothetical protein
MGIACARGWARAKYARGWPRHPAGSSALEAGRTIRALTVRQARAIGS